jgi:hypothetical protein
MTPLTLLRAARCSSDRMIFKKCPNASKGVKSAKKGAKEVSVLSGYRRYRHGACALALPRDVSDSCSADTRQQTGDSKQQTEDRRQETR